MADELTRLIQNPKEQPQKSKDHSMILKSDDSNGRVVYGPQILDLVMSSLICSDHNACKELAKLASMPQKTALELNEYQFNIQEILMAKYEKISKKIGLSSSFNLDTFEISSIRSLIDLVIDYYRFLVDTCGQWILPQHARQAVALRSTATFYELSEWNRKLLRQFKVRDRGRNHSMSQLAPTNNHEESAENIVTYSTKALQLYNECESVLRRCLSTSESQLSAGNTSLAINFVETWHMSINHPQGQNISPASSETSYPTPLVDNIYLQQRLDSYIETMQLIDHSDATLHPLKSYDMRQLLKNFHGLYIGLIESGKNKAIQFSNKHVQRHLVSNEIANSREYETRSSDEIEGFLRDQLLHMSEHLFNVLAQFGTILGEPYSNPKVQQDLMSASVIGFYCMLVGFLYYGEFAYLAKFLDQYLPDIRKKMKNKMGTAQDPMSSNTPCATLSRESTCDSNESFMHSQVQPDKTTCHQTDSTNIHSLSKVNPNVVKFLAALKNKQPLNLTWQYELKAVTDLFVFQIRRDASGGHSTRTQLCAPNNKINHILIWMAWEGGLCYGFDNLLEKDTMQAKEALEDALIASIQRGYSIIKKKFLDSTNIFSQETLSTLNESAKFSKNSQRNKRASYTANNDEIIKEDASKLRLSEGQKRDKLDSSAESFINLPKDIDLTVDNLNGAHQSISHTEIWDFCQRVLEALILLNEGCVDLKRCREDSKNRLATPLLLQVRIARLGDATAKKGEATNLLQPMYENLPMFLYEYCHQSIFYDNQLENILSLDPVSKAELISDNINIKCMRLQSYMQDIYNDISSSSIHFDNSMSERKLHKDLIQEYELKHNELSSKVEKLFEGTLQRHRNQLIHHSNRLTEYDSIVRQHASTIETQANLLQHLDIELRRIHAMDPSTQDQNVKGDSGTEERGVSMKTITDNPDEKDNIIPEALEAQSILQKMQNAERKIDILQTQLQQLQFRQMPSIIKQDLSSCEDSHAVENKERICLDVEKAQTSSTVADKSQVLGPNILPEEISLITASQKLEQSTQQLKQPVKSTEDKAWDDVKNTQIESQPVMKGTSACLLNIGDPEVRIDEKLVTHMKSLMSKQLSDFSDLHTAQIDRISKNLTDQFDDLRNSMLSDTTRLEAIIYDTIQAKYPHIKSEDCMIEKLKDYVKKHNEELQSSAQLLHKSCIAKIDDLGKNYNNQLMKLQDQINQCQKYIIDLQNQVDENSAKNLVEQILNCTRGELTTYLRENLSNCISQHILYHLDQQKHLKNTEQNLKKIKKSSKSNSKAEKQIIEPPNIPIGTSNVKGAKALNDLGLDEYTKLLDLPKPGVEPSLC